MTRAATLVLKHLEDSGVRYCVLHGVEEPPLDPEGDLDIACFPDEFPRLEAALNDREEVSCIQLIQHESTGYYFVLAIREGGSTGFLKLDVATDFRRNGRVFFKPGELLEGRRRLEGIWTSSPRTEFSYLLVKKTLKGAWPEHQKKRLQALRAELGQAAGEAAAILLGEKLSGEVLSYLSNGDWDAFENALPRMRKGLLRRALLRRPFSVLGYWLSECNRIRRRFASPTGLSVAVMGSDGAGKSTLVGRLKEEAADAFRASRLFHLRPGLLAPRPRRIPTDMPHGMPPYSPPLSLLKLLHFSLDYRLGHRIKVKPALTRSSLVLFDRYYHDILVDPLRYRYGGPHWIARIAGRFVPRPGLFLFLDVPRGDLLARKRELPADEVDRQRLGYARLAAELPNAVLLDGSLPRETVLLHARDAILRYLGERYRIRRRVWFPASHREIISRFTRLLFDPSQGKPGGSRRKNYALFCLQDGRGFLLPLGCRRAGARALEIYHAQRPKARAAKAFISAFMRRGIAPPWLPRVSLPEIRDARENGIEAASLFARLERLLGSRGLRFAVSFGTPGVHRKPVIQAISSGGEILAFVKVGWNPETRALVLHEGDILQNMKDLPFDSFAVPRVIYLDEWNGLSLLVEEAPRGKTTSAPLQLAPYLPVLAELYALHARRQRLTESVFWNNLVQRAAIAQKGAYGGLVLRCLRAVEGALGSDTIPFHYRHGDFISSNTAWQNGKAILFDWEYADREGPPGYDGFHFLYQKWTLLDRRPPAWIHDALRESGAGRGGIGDYLRALDAGGGRVEPLFLLYLLDRLVFCACGQRESFDLLPRLAASANLCLCDGVDLP